MANPMRDRPHNQPFPHRPNRKKVLLAALSAAFPVCAHAVPAAHVEFAIGNAVAVAASGASRPLAKGAAIESGDTINTKEGRVQLRFSDGAYVSLQPQTEFRIDDYRYEAKTDGSERGFFSLIKGGLRTITGLVGRTNKKNYRVSTSVATIGIRGTEYTITYGDVLTGSVGEGEINVCSGAGCVPFGSGQSFVVTAPTSTPQLTAKKSALPPPQPEDPAGGVFATANDPNSPNGQAGRASFAAGDVVLLLTGTANYSLAVSNLLYANVFPQSQLLTGLSTLDTTGLLVSFTAGGLNTMSGGTYSNVGNDGTIAWGTFTNGTIAGGSYAGSVTGGGALFYVMGLPAPTMPTTGTFTYNAIPGSLANSGGGATLTSATITLVAGATSSVSLALGFNSSAGAITANGSTTLTGGSTFSIPSLTLTNCFSCIGKADGFFAGANATRAGVSYAITNGSLGPIVGAVALTR